MQKLILYVSKYINNFNIIGYGEVINGYEVYITNEFNYSLGKYGVKTPIDLAIIDTNSDKQKDVIVECLGANRVLSLDRYGKTTMYLKLRNFLAKHNVSDDVFRMYNTYKPGLGKPKWVDCPKVVLVKTDTGARGIGQIKIDLGTSNITRLYELMDRYQGLTKMTGEDFLEALYTEFPSAKLSTRGEAFPGESLENLKERPYFIQEFGDDIHYEYRLLTDINGDICYIQKRELIETSRDFKQACGSVELVPSNILASLDEILTEEQKDILIKLSKELIGPLKSIDLFLTSQGKMGIFEWSNQFGVMGVPTDISRKIHIDAVSTLIKQYTLNKE